MTTSTISGRTYLLRLLIGQLYPLLFFHFLNGLVVVRKSIQGSMLLDLKLLDQRSGHVFIGPQLFEGDFFIWLDEQLGDFAPYAGFRLDGFDDPLVGGFYSRVNPEDPHEMSEVRLFGSMFQEVVVGKQSEHAVGRALDDVDVAKEVPLVLLVNFAFADEDVVEGLLNQHVQDVAFFMLEHQLDQIAKEPHLANASEHPRAGNRNAVAEHFQQSVVVDVHFGSSHHFVQSPPEQLNHPQNHRFALQLVVFLNFSLLIPVEGRERIVVNQRDEQTKSGISHVVVFLGQPHDDIDRRLVRQRLNHLFAVHYQIVLVHSLNQHRTQVLHHRSTVGPSPPPLLLHLLQNCLHHIKLHCQTFRLRP